MRRTAAPSSENLAERQNVFESRQACLVLFDDRANESVHPLCDDRTTFIGRSRGVEIQIEDAGVSNFHAAVFRHEGGWYIRDLDSTNGTCLNGEPVRHAQLRPNDRIEIAGVASLFFSDRGFRATPEPASPAAMAAAAALPPLEPAPEPVDLEALLRELAVIYDRWASEAGRSVALAVPAPLPPVRVDCTAASRVLDSFVRSALRRSPRGSCVRIGAKAVEGRRVEITIGGDAPLFEPAETERLLALIERERPGVVDQLLLLQGGAARSGTAPTGAARFTLSFPLDGPPPEAPSR